MADSARHDLFAIAEATYGETPATPSFGKFRHTGCTLALTKNTHLSEELRADRQIADFRHGVRTVGGDLNFELSYGSFDSYLEATLGGTWATDVLKAGTTRRSFSIMRHFSDILTADKPFHIFRGCEFNTLNLTIPADGMVTGSLSVLGKGLELTTTGITGQTLGTASTTSPFDSFTGSISEGGVAIAIVTELSLTLENGMEARNALFNKDAIGQASIGRSNVSGQITAYFENATMLEKFLNEVESSIEFNLTDLDGNAYDILIPRIKYNGGQPDVSGQGSIPLTLPFQGLYDPTEVTNIKITRTAA